MPKGIRLAIYVEEGNMIRENYHFDIEHVSEHALQVFKRGCCPSLMTGYFYRQEDICHVCIAAGGLFHLETFLKKGGVKEQRFEASVQPYKDTLGWLRKIVEGVALAEQYLVDKNLLSMRLEDMYFEAGKGNVRLLLKPSSLGFFESLCELCTEIFMVYPQSNGDVIRGRLEKENVKSVLNLHAVLRLLSSWECELN